VCKANYILRVSEIGVRLHRISKDTEITVENANLCFCSSFLGGEEGGNSGNKTEKKMKDAEAGGIYGSK
jgi:hypothetical protein